jgi:hypothetical protein
LSSCLLLKFNHTVAEQATLVDVILSMTDVKGSPISVQLIVRVAEKPTAIALELARAAGKNLSSPPIVAASQDIIGLVSNQKDIIASASSLLSKIDILLKIGDDIAKVCPGYSLSYLS